MGTIAPKKSGWILKARADRWKNTNREITLEMADEQGVMNNDW